MVMSSILNTKPGVKVPAVRPGDVVKVIQKFKEGEKGKTQSFQGVVIRVKKGGNSSNFTVRRISHGVGVERVFFFASPNLEKLEVLRQAKVRRARLYYLRKLSGSASRLKEKRREKVIAEEIAPVQAAPPEEIMMAAPAAEGTTEAAQPAAQESAKPAQPA